MKITRIIASKLKFLRCLFYLLPFVLQRFIRKIIQGGDPLVRDFGQLHIKEEFWQELNAAKSVVIWRGCSGRKRSAALDIILALALTLRGVKVRIVVCDKVLSGCINRDAGYSFSRKLWQDQCSHCMADGAELFQAIGLETVKMSSFVNSDDKNLAEKISNVSTIASGKKVVFADIPVGRIAYDSAVRYFKDIALPNNAQAKKIYQLYLYSAVINTIVSQKLLDAFWPDAVLMQHGIYCLWEPPLTIALNRKIRSIVWEYGYKNNGYYFRQVKSIEKTHPYWSARAAWEQLTDNSSSNLKENKVSEYLESYQEGKITRMRLDWTKTKEQSSLIKELKLDAKKPIWAIFPHLLWDAVFNFDKDIYKDPLEWLIKTIDHILAVDNIQWIIKSHPAEKITGTHRTMYAEILSRYSPLPSFIALLPPDSQVRTVDLLKIINGGVTIKGTVGLELALMGKPIITTGSAHYGELGFTYDAKSETDYYSLLDRVETLSRLNEQQVVIANKYAELFFNRAQHQLDYLKVAGFGAIRGLQFESLDSLKPGKDEILDFVCDRIINGGEFVRISK